VPDEWLGEIESINLSFYLIKRVAAGHSRNIYGAWTAFENDVLHPLVAEELNPKVTLIIAFPNGAQISIVHKYQSCFLCEGY
jgi:hypothetical protein